MNCRENSELLETFHDGELHGREMREFALHVAQCADCEAQLAEWDRLHGLLNESLAPEAEACTYILAALRQPPPESQVYVVVSVLELGESQMPDLADPGGCLHGRRALGM